MEHVRALVWHRLEVFDMCLRVRDCLSCRDLWNQHREHARQDPELLLSAGPRCKEKKQREDRQRPGGGRLGARGCRATLPGVGVLERWGWLHICRTHPLIRAHVDLPHVCLWEELDHVVLWRHFVHVRSHIFSHIILGPHVGVFCFQHGRFQGGEDLDGGARVIVCHVEFVATRGE